MAGGNIEISSNLNLWRNEMNFLRGILFTLLLLGFQVNALGAINGSPFEPHDDKRFDAIETLADGSGDSGGIQLSSGNIIVGDASGNANSVAMSGDATISNAGVVALAAGVVTEADLLAQSADGLHAKRVARATLDCGVSSCTVGALGLGVTLPANALLQRSFFYTVTQFVDGGAGTVALSCEDANNIFSAADITAITGGTVTDGVQDGTAATITGSIAAACEITATIAVAEQTSGKLILFVEYMVVE